MAPRSLTDCGWAAVLSMGLLSAIGAWAQEPNPAPVNIGSPTLTELWVDPAGGDDENTGSSAASALRTIGAAWALIPPLDSPATGYRVNLMPGTFPFDEMRQNFLGYRTNTFACPIIISAVNGPGTVTIQGGLNLSRVSFLYLVDLTLVAGNGISTYGNDVLHVDASTHVLVRGLTIRGVDPALYPDNYDLQEVIKVNQCQGIYVEDCDISGCFQCAVDYVAVQYGHVIRSKIHGSGDWAMYFKGGSSYITVSGNEFYATRLGFQAGEGTNFEVMAPPWLHYETYDIKFVNNILHDIPGVGISAAGAYNFLVAYNTLYKVATNSNPSQAYAMIQLVHGARGCVNFSEYGEGMAPVICRNWLNMGGWGTAVLQADMLAAGECIPNRNVYVYNNLLYNPAPFQTYYSHFYIRAAVTSMPANYENVPIPSMADDRVFIQGNFVWNGPADHGLGIDASTTLSADQLRADNMINGLEPQLVNPAGGDFRPLADGTVFSNTVFAAPNFVGSDKPVAPVVPTGNLVNGIAVDFNANPRSSAGSAGALIANSVASTPTPIATGSPIPGPTPTPLAPPGPAHLSVYQSASGQWLVFDPATLLTQFTALGGAGYRPVAGDYDGDGHTDFGVYASASGLWVVLLSGSGNQPVSSVFGGPGFVPIPRDYDGDGKADPAVYADSVGDWVVMLSGQSYVSASLAGFGGGLYAAVPADYDGDHKADPGVYACSLSQWSVLLSASGYMGAAAAFGGADLTPAAADYDGDGKTDPAVYAEATGTWTIMMSGSGYAGFTISLGGAGAIAIPGDYDGDGKADAAVYSAALGQWQMRLSSRPVPVTVVAFGGAAYVAVGPVR